MFGKGKETAGDDDVANTRPPADSSSTPDTSGDTTSTRERAREVLRRPVARAAEELRRPSVRIRRAPSSTSIHDAAAPPPANAGLHDIPEESTTGRRRSSSEPQRPSWFSRPDAGDRLARMSTVDEMPSVPDESTSSEGQRASLRAPRGMLDHLSPHLQAHIQNGDPEAIAQLQAHIDPHTEVLTPSRSRRVMNRLSNAAKKVPGVGGSSDMASDGVSVNLRDDEQFYDTQMVDLLDVIDPEVSTLSTLTNVQNSLFVPNLGRLVNRRPTYNLTRRGTAGTAMFSRPATAEPPEEKEEPVTQEQTDDTAESAVRPRLTHTSTISSTLSESRYAVLPHGESLAGWTPEEKAELNDLVRHMLHSRRAAFKRGMKGFGQYVRRPLGFFITLYATLITLFGAAWVLFLIGWISLGSRKDYIVNVVDNVLVALFAIMGDGLAPFRAVDTYHMIYIAHYHHLTWKLRRKKKLPKLNNRNDLPAKINPDETDLEYAAVETSEERREFRGTWEYSVLTTEQQKKLQHHQAKFAKSHTFYKPHETETHFAFPLRLLVAIVVLLDCHSLWQISLGATTWGIDYKVRPFWLTTFILCCSITCNIMGGVLISIGDHRTRKKEVIEKMFRQELTHSAMKEVRKKRLRAAEEAETSGLESDADGLAPVHVPPPVKDKKELEREREMAERVEQEKASGVPKKKSKNRWRAIPRLPWLIHKENEEFEKREREREKSGEGGPAP